MLQSRARRIPLVDIDDETHRPMVVSVITQYRILKFVAVNVKETQKLVVPLKDLVGKIGTYGKGAGGTVELATAHMDTPVMDVIHMLVRKNISSVPILDQDGEVSSFFFFPRGSGFGMLTYWLGAVINVFEAVDVITLIKGGVYDDLNLSVGDALLKRSDVSPLSNSLPYWYLIAVGLPRHIHLLCPRSSGYHLRYHP